MHFGNTKQILFIGYSLLEIRQTSGRKIREMYDSHALQAPPMISGKKENKEQDTAYDVDKSLIDLERYITSKPRRITIKWIPRRGQGLANNLRSIRGTLLLAIANNANICVDYDNYFRVMNNSLEILKCQPGQEYEFWPESVVMSWIKRQQCNYYLNNNKSIATCFDLSYYFSHCSNFVTDITRHINHHYSRHYLEYISSFIFQPEKDIIDYANSVLLSMKGIKVGIQLRFGGDVSVTKESGKFLNLDRFYLVINQLKQIFREIHKPISVFLSSDSQKAADMLRPLNRSFFTASKYNIGHSGRSATMERAVTDIYILSRCDVLVYTFRSSYGRFARDLSKSNKIFVLKTYFVCIINTEARSVVNFIFLCSILMGLGTILLLELLILLQNSIVMKSNMMNSKQITYSISLRASKLHTHDNNPIWANIGSTTSESYLPKIPPNLNRIAISFNDKKRESMPLLKYISNNKRSLLIKFKPKDNIELADLIGSMRGMLLFSIINNASFCTEDDGYFKFMDKSLKILECQNVTMEDYWDESKAIHWIKKHDCNYNITQNTEITAGYDLSIHISHCDNFIDNLIFYANELNTKEYREIVTKFLFQPKQSILKTADAVLSKLNYHFIGIEICVKKDYQLFIPNNTVINETPQSISKIIQELSRYDKSYSVYISSNLPKVKSSFKNVQRNIIFSEDVEQKVPSLKKNAFEKDVINIWILSQCYVLIHTSQSRNGEIAREITTIEEMNVINV